MTLKEIAIIVDVGFNQGSLDCSRNYMFSLQDTDVKEGHLLAGTCGRGKTKNAAKIAYAKLISGKVIVVNRREYQLPPKVTAR